MAHATRAHPDHATPMAISEHLRELRRRMFIVALVFLAASALAYYYRDPLLRVLLSPLEGQKLVYLNPAGGFSFIFLVSVYSGLAVSMPVLITQMYNFVSPALPAHVRRHASKIFLASASLLAAGIAFGFFIAIPGALRFLYSFAETYVTASLTADSYLNFVMAYTLGLGLVFQLPLLLMLVHWVRPLTPGGLFKSERWVIVLSFIAAAFITPTPDPLNQTIIALPIIVIYQFGIVAILISLLRKRRQERTLNSKVPAHQGTDRPKIPQPTEVPISTVTLTPPKKSRLSVDGIITGRPRR